MTSKLSLSSLVACLTLGVVLLTSTAVTKAQQPPEGDSFPGVQKALSSEQYSASGLSKLSPAERANLDNYLRGYFSGATQKVVEKATQVAEAKAVDRAVKEHKVEPPQLIDSRIVGRVSGWRSDRVFVLENGQHWKVVDNSNRSFGPVDNPEVFIVRDFLGYKMAIAGGGTARVKRLQ